MTFRVPFNRVQPVGHEVEYVHAALSGGHISGHGPFTARSEALLEDVLGSRRVLLTTSCTHALEMCALLLDIRDDTLNVDPERVAAAMTSRTVASPPEGAR